MNNRLEFTDLLNLFSVYLGLRNLTENEQQSDQQIDILRNINVGAENDKQAAYLLEELGRKFEEQKELLNKILEAVSQ